MRGYLKGGIVAPAVYPRLDKDSGKLVKPSMCGDRKGGICTPAVYPRLDKDNGNLVKPFMCGYLGIVHMASILKAVGMCSAR